MDPEFQTKKSRYSDPDSVLMDPNFYYPNPDSPLWISRFLERLRIGSRMESGSRHNNSSPKNNGSGLYLIHKYDK